MDRHGKFRLTSRRRRAGESTQLSLARRAFFLHANVALVAEIREHNHFCITLFFLFLLAYVRFVLGSFAAAFGRPPPLPPRHFHMYSNERERTSVSE